MSDGDGQQKDRKAMYYRLEDLDVAAVALVDRPAVDIEFLVLKRHTPPSEEDQMTNRRKADATDGQPAPETDTEALVNPETEPATGAAPLTPETLRAVKGISAMLGEILPEQAPEGDEVCVAFRALQAAVEKAPGATPGVGATEKDDPVDFHGAWDAQVLSDSLWKAVYTLETVIANINRTEKTPEEKVALFDTALNDFGGVMRQILGVAKAAPEPAPDAAADGDGKTTTDDATATPDPAPDAATKSADPAPADPAEAGQATGEPAVIELLNELVAWVKDLDSRVSKSESGETPEAPAADGAAEAATASAEKPVTFAQMVKVVRDEVAKLRKPVYKSKLPTAEDDKVPPQGSPEGPAEPPFNVFDREQRRKRLAALNIGLLSQQGIPTTE